MVPLPSVATSTAVPRTLTLSGPEVLNVSCPLPGDGAAVLCASRDGDDWLVTVPPDGDVVLVMLDLPTASP